MGYVTVNAGDVILSSTHNAEVRDQVISVFTDSTARGAAILAPVEGMHAYLSSENALTMYDGASWPYVYRGWADTSSSFVLGAATTPPTKGNSVYNVKWCRTPNAVFFRGRIEIGTTFSAGSGTYRIPLPVNAYNSGDGIACGEVMINDSGTALRGGLVLIGDLTFATLYYHNAAGTLTDVSSGGPGTAWAANDWFSWQMIYRPA